MPSQSIRITLSCARCSRPFEVYPSQEGRAKYCSVDCQFPRMTRPCLQCGAPFRVTLSALAKGRGHYCSQGCAGKARRDAAPLRFWSRVDRSGGPDACWPWQGRGEGYGQFRYRGKHQTAPHVAYLLTHGEFPPDKPQACHKCDNPRCCNPAHIFPGSIADNMADKVAKGRQARGDRQGARTHPESVRRGADHGSNLHPETVRRGEDSHRAKLTEGQVIAIRERHAAGEKTGTLAREYGIAPANIRKIVRRENWSHVA